MNNYEKYAEMSPRDVRELIRKGEITSPTSGMCAGYAQANLVILPKEDAYDFLLFKDGCIRYETCLDVNPETRDKFVSIVETWESEAHLKAHLGTAHMAAYREAVKDLRANSVVTVVEPV